MLSRIAALPSISNASPAKRALSTLPALRFNGSTRLHKDDRRDLPGAVPRSNPLIGNISVPLRPAPKPAALKSSPSTSSNPQKPRDELIPPPPPPPPQLQSQSESTAPPQQDKKPKSDKSPFAYDAADPSSDPFAGLNLSDLDLTSIISSKASAYGTSLGMGDPLSRPKVRTKAVTGRTVFISDRLTPTSAPTPIVAIRVLERMCREQKVRNKFHSQKFHERKGLKKKRLRSERWRARFKVGFKAAVSKVMELKKQGW